jgi:hypothetical protein
MWKAVLLIVFGLQIPQLQAINVKKDSAQVAVKSQPFLSLQTQEGTVLPTNDFIINSKEKPTFSAVSLKYGFSATKTRWQDYAYGMPYSGVGLMFAEFFNKQELGSPFALYAFQGTTLSNLSRKTKLNFEWFLGASFNWNPYDPFDNPENIALGSKTNIYVGGNIYTNFQLNKQWDVHTGIGLSHFSDGATRLPNKGINLISATVEFRYNFNRNSIAENEQVLRPPKIDKRIDYDFLINISSRQKKFDTISTNLPSPYVDKNFSVFGVTFAPMIVKSYKYKYGAGVDFLYDESSGARAWRQINPHDGREYDRVKPGNFGERISLGISARGELEMPMYSIFANLGYNVVHGNKADKRIYQVMGVKVYLKENLFGTFGIRASRFSQAQYLYWSLGYTIPGKLFSEKHLFAVKLRKPGNT